MNEMWSLFRKKEVAPFVLIVALAVFVFSANGCYQNYMTTYEQLTRVFGKDIGLTFTVLSQAIEFLVPVLLAWGIMKSLKFSWQITLFVVTTGVVAWVTDAATAGEHFWAAASQSSMVLRILWSVVGTFFFVTMEVWVMLSAVTVIAAINVLKYSELPQWITQPSEPVATPHLEGSQRGLLSDLRNAFRWKTRHVAQPVVHTVIPAPSALSKPTPRPDPTNLPDGTTWDSADKQRTYVVRDHRWEELRKNTRLEFATEHI